MSFVIGAIDGNGTLMLASDSKISSTYGIAQYENANKIIKFSDNIAIGVTGHFKLASKIIQECKQKYPSSLFNRTREQFYSFFNKVALNEARLFLNEVNQLANCAFIIGIIENNKAPYISLVTLCGEDIQLFTEPFIIGEYKFLFINPVDMEFSHCKQICETTFYMNKNQPIKKALTQIVSQISLNSQYVNDDVCVWTSPLQAYTQE